ncbi:Crp/Fnr family transcriptional regulator [Fundidesulfovibrio butyratiphilus]
MACAYSEHLDILRGLPIFAGSPPEALKLLAYLSQVESYAEGQTLAVQGQDARAFHHLRRGRALAVRELGARPVPVRELGPGDNFGALVLAVGGTNLFTVRAATELITLTVTGEALNKACDSFPALRPALLTALTRQVLAWEEDFIRRRPDDFTTLSREFGISL